MDNFIYEKILLELPLIDILRCRLVSRSFNEIIKEDYFWNKICQRDIDKDELKYVEQLNVDNSCKKYEKWYGIKKFMKEEEYIFANSFTRLNNTKFLGTTYIKKHNDKYYLENCFAKVLHEIPKSIKYLTNLKDISLQNNKIKSIPNDLSLLYNLESINLSNNEISEIHVEWSKLKKIEFVDLSNNKIREIPSELYRMEKLKMLKLDNNDISQITNKVKGLTSLESLHLEKNKICHIPNEIYRLKKIRLLNFSNNLIKNISDKVFDLRKETIIILTGNNTIMSEEMKKIKCIIA